jgi:hypothetical protein
MGSYPAGIYLTPQPFLLSDVIIGYVIKPVKTNSLARTCRKARARTQGTPTKEIVPHQIP